MSGVELDISIDSWPRKRPLRLTGHVSTEACVVTVTLSHGDAVGRGEAAGVRYRGESAETIAAEIEAARAIIEAGIGRAELQAAMPAGGARNALDCALW